MKRTSGLLLILLLLAALLVLFLSVKQMDAFGFGGKGQIEDAETSDAVQQARDAVDAVNQRLGETGAEP